MSFWLHFRIFAFDLLESPPHRSVTSHYVELTRTEKQSSCQNQKSLLRFLFDQNGQMALPHQLRSRSSSLSLPASSPADSTRSSSASSINWVVERILAHRPALDGTAEYQILWLSYVFIPFLQVQRAREGE